MPETKDQVRERMAKVRAARAEKMKGVVVEPPKVKIAETESEPVTAQGATDLIELRHLSIGRPQKRPTEKQILDYVRFITGQVRLKLRDGSLDDIDEVRICLKLKKRF